jgi:hypothetical protein
MLGMHASSSASIPMGTNATEVRGKCLEGIPAAFLRSGFILLAAISAALFFVPKAQAYQGQSLTVRLDAPESDVLKAVDQVSQDQIIHGTYSYEKERILYGAHSADSARAFGVWHGQGKVFYKVANKVLSPRFFKDSEDIGTVSVRYVVQDAGPDAATVQIDAVFVDARNVRHPSLGNVESSEYAAIQQHLKNIQEVRRQALDASAATGAAKTSSPAQPAASQPPGPASDSSLPGLSVRELQKRVDDLRHQVELRVKDAGAQLKSAPFRSATTLESLPPQTEVLIVVLTPYWYGVETEDGHRGWVHHSQLEPLP